MPEIKKPPVRLKYRFPMGIFMILEKLEPVIFTSKTLTRNHHVIFLPNTWYYPMNLCLKNETFHSVSKLIDISAIDTLKYNNVFPHNEFISRDKRFLHYNIYYCYHTKLRVTLIQTSSKKMLSIDKIFRNASWLERETSEMFGINYTNKSDIRSLLLDYSRNENPMLKDFPTEGYEDVYYNIFEEKIMYIKHDYVEL